MPLLLMYGKRRIVDKKSSKDQPRREDYAIEEFCQILSYVEQHPVYIESRPDDRGRTGEGKVDAIINRGGSRFALEHTSLMSYKTQGGSKTQKQIDELYSRYIVPLRIEETI